MRYADASFANDLGERFSTAGHIVFVGSGPVHWKGEKQAIVATSSTDAEAMNPTPAGMPATWISKLLFRDLKVRDQTPMAIFTDGQNARITALNKTTWLKRVTSILGSTGLLTA